MITVPEATKKVIERSRFLSEAMAKDLINLSSLARYIKPELEEMLIKDISEASILMSLKRIQKAIKPKYSKGKIFKTPPEMMVHSGLFLVALTRTNETEKILGELFLNREKGTFSSVAIGATELQIVGAEALYEKLIALTQKEHFVQDQTKVSQITIYLPDVAIETPGVYYFLLKSLAWEGINILGSASTKSEYSLFFEDKDISRAFEILSSLFVKEVI